MPAISVVTLAIALAQPAPAFKRLHAEHAEASSWLRSNWNKYEENYHPNYALDDDPATAWVEGVDGDGVGQSLRIPVSDLAGARAIRVVMFGGYQKSKALLAANAAPKKARISVHAAGGKETGKLDVTLKKAMGAQSFEVPVQGGVSDVTITVLEAHPGTKYADLCISDVQILVDSDVPYVASVEQGKFAALKAWKKERLDSARYFASLPRAYPYATTRLFSSHDDNVIAKRWKGAVDEDKDGYPDHGIPTEGYVRLDDQIANGRFPDAFAADEKALLSELHGLSKKQFPKDARWFAVDVKERVTPPDGFPLDRTLEPLMHLTDATLFEAKDAGSAKPVLVNRDGYQEGAARSNLLVIEGTAGDVKKAYVTVTRVVLERVATSRTEHLLVTFDGGRPVRIARLATEKDTDGIGYSHAVAGVWDVTSENGKVAAFKAHELVESSADMEEVDLEEGTHEVRATWSGAPRS